MRVWAALTILLLTSCSDSDAPDPDATIYDAALGADSSEILPDAAATTICGIGKQAIECLADSEICVNEDLGGTVLSTCEPLPTGCNARDCASCDGLCVAPADTCDDDEAENSITCVCLEC